LLINFIRKNGGGDKMAVDVNRLNKKIQELQKRYPDNTYKIQENKKEIKGKPVTTVAVVRTSGRRPHKTKEQMKLARDERARIAREAAD